MIESLCSTETTAEMKLDSVHRFTIVYFYCRLWQIYGTTKQNVCTAVVYYREELDTTQQISTNID